MSTEIDPNDFRYTHTREVSMIAMRQMPDYIHAQMRREMREALAEFLLNAHVSKDYHEDYYQERVEIFAAPPAQFWALVNQEAERIAMRYGLTVARP